MSRLTLIADVLFPVEEHPVFVCVKDGPAERRLPVPDKKAIVNAENLRVLGIVSQGYRLVTNNEALDMAKECCRAVFPETKTGEWDIGTIDAPSTAGHCYMDLVHNSTVLDFSFVPAAERPEVFGPFIRVTNSYNGLRALAFDIGFFRKVCSNGLILPDSVIRFKFVHLRRAIGESIVFDIAHDRLAKMKASFADLLGPLISCQVSRDHFGPLVHAVLKLIPPDPLKCSADTAKDWDALIAHLGKMQARYLEEFGENAYAALNAITEFASNPPAIRCIRRDRHSLQRLAGSWVATFNSKCCQSDFSLDGYIEELTETKPGNSGRLYR